MDVTKTSSQDEQVLMVEIVVAKLLRIGTAIAAVQIAAGLALLLLGIAEPLGTTILTTGLITLVCTPLMRVTAALWIYLKLGDRTYAVISLFVLAVVFAGMLLGQTH